jgi:hypothetical protein
VVVSLVAACSSGPVPSEPLGEDPTIGSRLAKAAGLAADATGELSVAGIAPIGTDSMAVFGPYADSELAAEVLGFDWDLSAASPWVTREGGAVVVFVEDNRVLAWSAIRTSTVDLECLDAKLLPVDEPLLARRDEYDYPLVGRQSVPTCLPDE